MIETLYSTYILLPEGSKNMVSPSQCTYMPSDPVNSFQIWNEHLFHMMPPNPFYCLYHLGFSHVNIISLWELHTVIV
jgi:hypothetical protein